MVIITRRRDQVTFKPDLYALDPATQRDRGPSLQPQRSYAPFTPTNACDNPDEIIGGVIVAETQGGVQGWIRRLSAIGFNYFTTFQDVHGPAVQFGRRR